MPLSSCLSAASSCCLVMSRLDCLLTKVAFVVLGASASGDQSEWLCSPTSFFHVMALKSHWPLAQCLSSCCGKIVEKGSVYSICQSALWNIECLAAVACLMRFFFSGSCSFWGNVEKGDLYLKSLQALWLCHCLWFLFPFCKEHWQLQEENILLTTHFMYNYTSIA